MNKNNRAQEAGLLGTQGTTTKQFYYYFFFNYGFRDLKYARYYRAHQKLDILALVLLERQEHIKCH